MPVKPTDFDAVAPPPRVKIPTEESSGKPESSTGLMESIFSFSSVVLFLICLMYGLGSMVRHNLNIAAPFLLRDLGVPASQLGGLFFTFSCAYVALQVPGGWLSDRFGARHTLTACGVIWSVSTILMGVLGNLPALGVCFAVLGMGQAAAFPSATRALSDWTSPGNRGSVQGLTHSFARLVSVIAPALLTWLIKATSWRQSFMILGGATLLWTAVWCPFFRDDPAGRFRSTPSERQMLTAYAGRAAKPREPVPWLALSLRMLPVTVVYFCYGWTAWLFFSWLPLFLMAMYQLDRQHSALWAIGVYVLGAIGNIAGGLASDAILRHTGDRNKARRNLIIIGLLGSFVLMIPVMTMSSLTARVSFLQLHQLNFVVACLAAAFFFAEFTVGPFWAIAMDIAPRYSGSASGMMNLGAAMTAVLSPLVAGFVIQSTRNYSLPIYGSMGLLLLGAALAYRINPSEAFARGEVDTLRS